ncbi:uncharacterized protein LOC142346171 [Convolutriloba macropyga]|uniref:uncharacterized protein LOC142346171 n=1 Tax=Convolutriloba macropyga TaxID=536237 RepID=UPI003F526096
MDGCDGTDSVNFLVYSKVFDPHPCAKLNVFINRYDKIEDSPPNALFHLGIIQLTSDSEALSPDLIDNRFETLQTKTESSSIAFGNDHIETSSKFKLAIKFERSCGTWKFRTGNVKGSYDIEMSQKTCSAVVDRLVKFEETCQRNQSDDNFEIFGECVENSVPTETGVKPVAYCYDSNNGYITDMQAKPLCVCKAGFEPTDLALKGCKLCGQVLTSENVLINDSGICRVAGFEDRVEFNKQPQEMFQRYLRYWPPEVIKDGCFSPATDIWSFGALIWHCFNPGEPQPFDSMTDPEVENYVISGQKLEIESGDTSESVMPPQLSTVMEACFAYTPLHRPSAFDLREHIHNILFPIRLSELALYSTTYSIRHLLEQNKIPEYQDLFKVKGVNRIDQLDWTDSALKEIGIQDGRHRRKLITEASKLLHGDTIVTSL